MRRVPPTFAPNAVLLLIERHMNSNCTTGPSRICKGPRLHAKEYVRRVRMLRSCQDTRHWYPGAPVAEVAHPAPYGSLHLTSQNVVTAAIFKQLDTALMLQVMRYLFTW